MGTRRIKIQRPRRVEITDEVIALYQAGDYEGLHRALGLKPWELSPLPYAVTAVGVDEDPPDWVSISPYELRSWNRALTLQRQIKQAIAEREEKR